MRGGGGGGGGGGGSLRGGYTNGNDLGRPPVRSGAYCLAAMGGRWPLLGSLLVRYLATLTNRLGRRDGLFLE